MATKQSAGLRMSAGVAAAAVGLGVAQLLASFFSPAADVRTAVGTAVVNLTPGPAKEWAIQTFGTADKLFLAVMVILVIAALAALAARWERSRVPLGSLFFVAAGVIGCAAVLARPGASPADLIPTLVGIGSAIAVLRLLTSGRIREGVDGTAGADGVEVEVADTGPGLPADLLAELFQPFVTRKQGGTGLGLWISRSLVERYGGDILAANAPAGGAVFTVRLPTEAP